MGRRTALTFPLLPPPQKNRSPPSDSSPDTPTPGGISSRSRTSPVRGLTRLNSLSSPSQVPCQSPPSIQVTPVTKRFDSMVRSIAPVCGRVRPVRRIERVQLVSGHKPDVLAIERNPMHLVDTQKGSIMTLYGTPPGGYRAPRP